MATILDQRRTIDGYDVRIITAGDTHTLHFSVQPSADDLSDAIAAFETAIMDAAMAETEETINGLFDQ